MKQKFFQAISKFSRLRILIFESFCTRCKHAITRSFPAIGFFVWYNLMYRTNLTQNDRYSSPNDYRDQNNSVFFSMLPENLCFVFFFSFRWQKFTQLDNFLVSPIFSKLLRQEFNRIEFYYSPINFPKDSLQSCVTSIDGWKTSFYFIN